MRESGRVLSAILAAAMLFTSMPATGMTAYAVETIADDEAAVESDADYEASVEDGEQSSINGEQSDAESDTDDGNGSADAGEGTESDDADDDETAADNETLDDGEPGVTEDTGEDDTVDDTMEVEPVEEAPVTMQDRARTEEAEVSLASDGDVTAESDFEWDEDGTTITGYTGSDTDVVIPAKATAIAAEAFYQNATIRSLSFAGDEIEIGESAFAETHLKSVTLPGGTTFDGGYQFDNCQYLSSVTLEKGITEIPEGAFTYNIRLKEITIPESVQSMGGGAFTYSGLTSFSCSGVQFTFDEEESLGISGGQFAGCKSLESVTLRNVTALGHGMFQNCTSLTTINLPEGLEEIGDQAFYGCSALTNIDLPDTVQSLGIESFSESGITEITIPASVTDTEIAAFNGSITLTQITFAEGMKAIPKWCEKGSSSVRTVVIPSTATSIADSAFQNFTALEELDLSGTQVASIGEQAFLGCYALTTIRLPDTLTSIGYRAFYNCTDLTAVDLSDTQVTTIGERAFEYCTSLEELELSPTLETIEGYALHGCKSLTGIVIPASLSSVGESVFWQCSALDRLEYVEGTTTILGVGAENVSTVVLPSTTEVIGDSAFCGYSNLTTINLPSSIKSIEDYAFGFYTSGAGPKSLKELRFEGPGDIDIATQAFNGSFNTTDIPVYCVKGSKVYTYFVNKTGFEAVALAAPLNTIQYVLNGGTNAEENPTTYSVDDALTLLDPTRNGYAFTGWYIDEGLTESFVYEQGTTSGDLTLYAGWEIATYQIGYVLNGGTNAEGNPIRYSIGSDLTFLDPAREGYRFLGWYADDRFTTPFVYEQGTTVGDLELYAAWEEIRYQITYDLNGGTLPSGMSNPTSYVSSEDCVLITPIKNQATFAGWKVGDTDTVITDGWIYAGTYAEDLHLTALWEEPSYQIVWNKNAKDATGSMDPTSLHVSDVYEMPGDGYTRAGYDLASWNTKANGKGTSYAVGETVQGLLTADGAQMTLYAQWQQSIYEIVYELNDTEASPAVNNKSNPDSYTIGKKVALKNPTRTGYTFGGWYTDAALTTKVTKVTSDMGDVTLYAQWTPITYTITFNKNKGTLPSGKVMNNITATYDQAVAFPNNVYVRNGCTFVGWNTEANGKGTSYAVGDVIPNLAARNKTKVTLYAQWETIGRYITYELGDSEEEPAANSAKNPDYVTIEKNVVLSAPTRIGYTFKGWYTDEGLTTALAKNTIPKTTTEDITVYAKWEPNTYTLKLDKNSGTYTIPTEVDGITLAGKHLYTDEITLPDGEEASRTNYTLTGWNTRKDRTGTHYDLGESVSRLAVKGTVTLYAEWTPVADKTYQITYLGIDANWDNSKNPETYSFEKDVKLVNPTREGYTFKGWYAQDPDTNPKARKVTAISKKTTGDMDLYGVWTENTYTIAYNANKGTLPKGSRMAAQTVQYSRNVTLTANVYTRKGYTFTGWNTKANGTGDAYNNAEHVTGLVSKAKGKITLYAQWEAVDYTITYVNVGLDGANTGGLVNGNPETYTIEKDVKLATPTLYGYTFKGWYSANPSSNPKAKKVTKIAKTTATNAGVTSTTVYALWEENSYSLRFATNSLSGSSVHAIVDKRYTESIKIPATVPTRDGYTFKGWALTRNGSTVCEPGNTVTFEQLHAAGGTAKGLVGTKYMTLYAIYWPNT